MNLSTHLHLTDRMAGEANAHLLGANLDLASDLPQAISSERLRNPTFCGPAEPGTGLAPHWKKLLDFSGGYFFMLEPGHNRVGGPAQRMHVTHGDGWLVQPGCWVRAGETLRIRLWARCQEGAPVTLRVGFRHRGLAGPWYGQAEIVVNRSYFAPYTCEVRISASDDDCLFGCQMRQPGIVYFDRISVHATAEGGTRADTLEAMRELAVPDLRWPSGCTSTGYHWRRGVGPEDERHDDADPVFHWGMSYTWGTDEYLELCTELGIRPHLIANVGTGTPREAAEWAAYCAAWYRARGRELPEMVWQIGNEHYGTHEIGHMDSEQYADCLIDYAPGIRAAYPRAILCTTALGENEVAPILNRAREHADLIAVHHYACRVDFNPAREALAFVGDVDTYARQLDQLADKVKASGSHAGLAITEWGAFRSETHTDATFCDPVDAGRMLYVAASLNAYARRSRYLKLANFYSLVNFMPAIIARGPNVERTLKHAIFRFWRPLFPATIREVTVDGPGFTVPQTTHDPAADRDPAAVTREPVAGDTVLPWIDALAGAAAAGDWLLLTNRHPTETLAVTLPEAYAGATVDRLLPTCGNMDFRLQEGGERAQGPVLEVPPWSHARVWRPTDEEKPHARVMKSRSQLLAEWGIHGTENEARCRH